MKFRKSFRKAVLAITSALIILSAAPLSQVNAKTSVKDIIESYGFVILDNSNITLSVGDETSLIYVTSNGKKPSFKSSDSKVASVNTYGVITAKGPGTCTITAKISNGEASCRVYVESTKITLSSYSIFLDNGFSETIKARTSTGHPVTWKIDKKSIATIDEKGRITAKKPGSATITCTCDKTKVTANVTVRKPDITLSKTALTLYAGDSGHLTAKSTSKSPITWKVDKRSIATVDEAGNITALKAGVATVTAKCDGVSKACKVTVKNPK